MSVADRITITDALFEVSQTLTAGTSLASLLTVIKETAPHLIDAGRASAFPRDARGNEPGHRHDPCAIPQDTVGEVIASDTAATAPLPRSASFSVPQPIVRGPCHPLQPVRTNAHLPERRRKINHVHHKHTY
jgi:hypothetical protein